MLLLAVVVLGSMLSEMAAQGTWPCNFVEETLLEDGEPEAPPTTWWSSNGANFVLMKFATNGTFELQSVARVIVLGTREVSEKADLCIGIVDSTTYTNEPKGGRERVAWITFHTESTYPVAIVTIDISCWKQKRSISQCQPQLRAPLWFQQLPLYHHSPLSRNFWSDLTEATFPNNTKSWLHKINQQSNAGLSIQPHWLALAKLPSLNSLELTGNNWSNVPPVLPPLPLLTELKLHANNITSLPDDFFQNMTNLVTIILARNRLSKLPSSITTLKRLHLLDVTNPLSPKVPFSINYISDVSNIRVLGLENQMLEGSILPIIVMQNLTFLNVSACGLKTLENATVPLDNKVTDLQVLDLSKNHLEVVSHKLLMKFPKLDRLLLNNNLLHTLGSSDYFPLSQLTILDLSYNYINVMPTFKNKSPLKTLILRSNGLRGFVENFWDYLPNLQRVDLSQNQLTNMPNFSQNMKIEVLDLSHNEFVLAYKGDFESMKQLSYLNLSHNLLTVVDEEIFRDFELLKITDFSWNRLWNIKLTGAKVETIILSHNLLTLFPQVQQSASGVHYLDLSYNLISNVKLTKESFPRLQTLNLAWNKISEADFGNATIRNVDLSYNKLAQLPLGTSSIVSFNLKDNSFGNGFNQNDKNNTVLKWMNFMMWPIVVATVFIILIFLGLLIIVAKKLRKRSSSLLALSSYHSKSSTLEYSQHI